MPEVTVALAGRKDEIIVWNLHVRTIGETGDHIALILIDRTHLAKDYRGIPLPGENSPNGSPDLAWSQNGGCYLVKQRLKQMVICPVEQNHFDWSPAESFSCRQATKAASNDYNTRQFLIHRPAWGSRLLFANSHFCAGALVHPSRSNSEGRTGLTRTDLSVPVKYSARESA
jgi:hypothetical protein